MPHTRRVGIRKLGSRSKNTSRWPPKLTAWRKDCRVVSVKFGCWASLNCCVSHLGGTCQGGQYPGPLVRARAHAVQQNQRWTSSSEPRGQIAGGYPLDIDGTLFEAADRFRPPGS